MHSIHGLPGITVARERGGCDEAVHHVRVAIWSPRGVATTDRPGDPPILLRSAAKPVQATACVVTGAADRLGLLPRHLAVGCASHSGQPGHVRTAAEVLARAGLGPEALDCGPPPPVHAPDAARLLCDGTPATPLHNNCSGKHANMLAACVAAGWPTAGYIDPAHPLQRLIREHVAAASGVPEPEIGIGMDGCSVPVFALPLTGAARLFAALAAPHALALPARLAGALARLSAAMVAAPWMVGGTGRADTDVLRASAGRIVSKVGAEGLWCLGLRGAPVGIAVKCADGLSEAGYRAGLALLRAAGAFDDRAWAALRPHHECVRRNHAGRVIGNVRVTVPHAIVEALANAVEGR